MKLFVNRDLGPSIGQALASVGVDAVNHITLFDPDAPDAQWIPAVAADDRVILSKDRHLTGLEVSDPGEGWQAARSDDKHAMSPIA